MGRLVEVRPQHVCPGGEAQYPHGEHPKTGYEVDATLGYRPDAASLAASAAQDSVEAEGEPSEAAEDQQDAYREDAGDP